MSDRRFSESEVAEIFERAAEAQVTDNLHLPPGEGMTLAQLKEIGREVGISPEAVSLAAQAVESGGQPMSRYFLGLPVAVGMDVDLGRKLSDAEWDRLVVDLRDTFDAPGKLTQEGSFRQWSNGNLKALLEPGLAGHRLRLRTEKGDARGLISGGLAMLAFAVTTGVAALAGGGLDDTGLVAAMGTLATVGAGMFGISGLRLPGWARLRRRQMEAVIARATTAATTERMPDLPDKA